MTGPFLVRLAFDDDGSPAGHAVPSHYPADAAAPQLSVLDLAATRGDGVFETISVGNGHLQALEPHLERFARSAAMLDLPAPDAAQWRAAIREVAAHLADVDEAFVKIVMTRGVEGSAGAQNPGLLVPTGWALAAVAPDHGPARRDGIRIAMLDRGYRHDVAQTSPWLLAGAKTLSYAINRGVFREAARRDADDALFVSSDGYLLEGAVSNLILKRGDTLLTPRTDLGILAGTTQADVFRWAGSQGMSTEYGLYGVDDLLTSDAAWLVSSGRHAAPIRTIDAEAHPMDAELTAEINRFLHSRTE